MRAGAGIAAALTAAQQGARVNLVTKLRIGDSNTVMAEGGIQASVDPEDTPQKHFQDTVRGGGYHSDPSLVKQMVLDGPEVIRWLIQQGMNFDQKNDDPFGDLILKRPGGASAPRILSYRDYTGLEMMRVLREALAYQPGVISLSGHPVVELLSDEHGGCAGAVLYQVERKRFRVIRAGAVILATGGLGRLHLNEFPTSNHFGATGDGLILAYRLGAELRELDSFQYHPTGLAFPKHLAGSLVSEAARSAGALLRNGLGQRFVDELSPRDVVSAAILRECREGRAVEREGQLGVWLDTRVLTNQQLRGFGALCHQAKKCGHDPSTTPFMVYPTLHYQNGGVAIQTDGLTTVPRLFCAGEITGGIHGRNRLMGNALLEIISFGRRAGARAAELRHQAQPRKATLAHVHAWQRCLAEAGLPLDRHSPSLFPGYANFRLREHLEA